MYATIFTTNEVSHMRKLFALSAIAAAMTVGASTVQAQLPKGYTDIGIVAGLGNTGEAGIAPGARFERIIKDLPNMGGGTLGIGAGVNYYSWSVPYFKWSYLPIGVTANYHFKLENKKWDAFLGAGLGYQIISCDYTGIGVDVCSNSTTYFIVRAGGRYFVNSGMAVYADAGAGDAALNVGLTFKLK